MSRDVTAARGIASIGLVSWRSPVSGPELLDLADRMGLEGVQLDFGGPGRVAWLDEPGNAARMLERSAETGVELLAVAGNVLNDIGLTAPAGTAAAAEVERLLARMLDIASALGCPLVFVPSFRRSAIDGSAALRRTAKVLSWAAGEASDRGLTLANENTLGPERALALIEEVASPGFRLVLDTYNLPSAGVDPAAIAAVLAPHLADQVHLKDGIAGDTTVPLGGGDGNLESTLESMACEPVAVRFLVLENDYRDGDEARLRTDVGWARKQAERFRRSVGDTHE